MPPSKWSRVWEVVRQEIGVDNAAVWRANVLGRLFPSGSGGRVRVRLYRMLGIGVGRETIIAGPITFAGSGNAPSQLRMGSGCFINSNVYIDASAAVTLGDGVYMGHHVMVVTSGHAIGRAARRAGTLERAPVTVGDGAWLGARATLLPGVTIGAGAVVAAGAVVTKDIPPHTVVGGVPARVIRALDPT